jgi:hypothetical protein
VAVLNRIDLPCQAKAREADLEPAGAAREYSFRPPRQPRPALPYDKDAKFGEKNLDMMQRILQSMADFEK